MTSSTVLLIFTGFALIFALLAIASAVQANRERVAAEFASDRVRESQGRLIALEGSLESLHAAHRKLSGQFHASKRWDADPRPDNAPPSIDRDELRKQYLPSSPINGVR